MQRSARAIANTKAVMRPGGLAVISLPNRLSLPFLLGWLAYGIGWKPKDEEVFKRHLDYPFYRTIRLFEGMARTSWRSSAPAAEPGTRSSPGFVLPDHVNPSRLVRDDGLLAGHVEPQAS